MSTKQKHTLSCITLLLILGGIFLVAPAEALSQEEFSYTALEPLPNLTGEEKFPQYIEGLYRFAIGTVGIAALLMLSIGGFMYITSAGNNANAESAKRVIRDALLGLVVVLFGWLILNQINPDLVNVNLSSLGEIDTTLTPNKTDSLIPFDNYCNDIKSTTSDGDTIGQQCTSYDPANGTKKVCQTITASRSTTCTDEKMDDADRRFLKREICGTRDICEPDWKNNTLFFCPPGVTDKNKCVTQLITKNPIESGLCIGCMPLEEAKLSHKTPAENGCLGVSQCMINRELATKLSDMDGINDLIINESWPQTRQHIADGHRTGESVDIDYKDKKSIEKPPEQMGDVEFEKIHQTMLEANKRGLAFVYEVEDPKLANRLKDYLRSKNVGSVDRRVITMKGNRTIADRHFSVYKEGEIR